MRECACDVVVVGVIAGNADDCGGEVCGRDTSSGRDHAIAGRRQSDRDATADTAACTGDESSFHEFSRRTCRVRRASIYSRMPEERAEHAEMKNVQEEPEKC